MQPVARNVQLSGIARPIQQIKNAQYATRLPGLDAANISFSEKLLDSLVPKSPDHLEM
jgi:hypothetical protein